MKIRQHVIAAAAALAAVALVASGCSSSDSGSDAKTEQGFPETMQLAAVPAENSADLKASYDPLIKLLEKETGSKIEFVQASDYAGVVEGMIAKNVDLAFFGPFAYVVARLNGAKITPLGAVIDEQGATPGYQSYGLAKLVADAVEKIEPGPVEAVRSVGGGWWKVLFSAVIPQATPAMVGSSLYMLDVNVRTSTTLGIVGAGGIGYLLFESIRTRNFDVAGAIVLIIFVVVYAIERLSGWIRSRLV